MNQSLPYNCYVRADNITLNPYMFRFHPNLLGRDTYRYAKLQKILQIVVITASKILFLLNP